MLRVIRGTSGAKSASSGSVLALILVVAACGDLAQDDSQGITSVTLTPARSLEPDTGTTLDGLGCGGVSRPCDMGEVSGGGGGQPSGVLVINVGTQSDPTWARCDTLQGGCLNVDGQPVFGSSRWPAAPPEKPQGAVWDAYAAVQQQRMDIDIAIREIMCPELRALAQDMLQDENIWIAPGMPSPDVGDFNEEHGNQEEESEHAGTIYIREDVYWTWNGYYYVFNGNTAGLAEVLAHEAAHAWFGYGNSISPDQHEQIYVLGQSCT